MRVVFIDNACREPWEAVALPVQAVTMRGSSRSLDISLKGREGLCLSCQRCWPPGRGGSCQGCVLVFSGSCLITTTKATSLNVVSLSLETLKRREGVMLARGPHELAARRYPGRVRRFRRLVLRFQRFWE